MAPRKFATASLALTTKLQEALGSSAAWRGPSLLWPPAEYVPISTVTEFPAASCRFGAGDWYKITPDSDGSVSGISVGESEMLSPSAFSCAPERRQKSHRRDSGR